MVWCGVVCGVWCMFSSRLYPHQGCGVMDTVCVHVGACVVWCMCFNQGCIHSSAVA